MSQREAAMMYGVAKTTLHDHLKDASLPERITQGRFKPTFTMEQEEELVAYIIKMSERFFAMTRLALVQKAFKLAEINQIPHRFRNGQAGKDWATAFLRRHKDRISVRTATALSIPRVLGFTKDAVDKFFDNLENIVRARGYNASQIYNADETGVSIVSTRREQVLGRRGARDVAVIKAAERGALVTVLACCSAAGKFVPPMFIFPGSKNRRQEEMVSRGPVGSVSENTKRGWISHEVFFKWLQHFKDFSEASETNEVLLILDNHSCHISFQVVEYARENYIDILTLPPHSSHRLQPLDIGFFSPLKLRYSQALREWMSAHKHAKPQLLDIPAILKPAYESSAKKETAENSFRRAGIWDPNLAFPNRALIPAEAFRRADATAKDSVATPPTICIPNSTAQQSSCNEDFRDSSDSDECADDTHTFGTNQVLLGTSSQPRIENDRSILEEDTQYSLLGFDMVDEAQEQGNPSIIFTEEEIGEDILAEAIVVEHATSTINVTLLPQVAPITNDADSRTSPEFAFGMNEEDKLVGSRPSSQLGFSIGPEEIEKEEICSPSTTEIKRKRQTGSSRLLTSEESFEELKCKKTKAGRRKKD